MSLLHRRTAAEWKKLAENDLQKLANDADKAATGFGTLKAEINEFSLGLKKIREKPNHAKIETLKLAAKGRSEFIVKVAERLREQLLEMIPEAKEVGKAAGKSVQQYKVTFSRAAAFGKATFEKIISEDEVLILGRNNWSTDGNYAPMTQVISKERLSIIISEGSIKVQSFNGDKTSLQYEKVKSYRDNATGIRFLKEQAFDIGANRPFLAPSWEIARINVFMYTPVLHFMHPFTEKYCLFANVRIEPI